VCVHVCQGKYAPVLCEANRGGMGEGGTRIRTSMNKFHGKGTRRERIQMQMGRIGYLKQANDGGRMSIRTGKRRTAEQARDWRAEMGVETSRLGRTCGTPLLRPSTPRPTAAAAPPRGSQTPQTGRGAGVVVVAAARLRRSRRRPSQRGRGSRRRHEATSPPPPPAPTPAPPAAPAR
jgi:hypothetical protein